MEKKYIVRLSDAERETCTEVIRKLKGTSQKVRRAQILLKADAPGPGAPDEFNVHVARSIDAETAKDAESYSRHVVAEAGAGRSLLAIDAAHDDRFRELKSVSLYNIRSLMCVPLRSRGKIIGTVYLDSRSDGVLSTENDLRFLEAFADHAALALENIVERAKLQLQNRRLQSAAETRTRFANIVGRSPEMQNIFSLIETVASSNLPVLIHGESGTGKELVARAIHFQGSRRRRPLFVSAYLPTTYGRAPVPKPTVGQSPPNPTPQHRYGIIGITGKDIQPFFRKPAGKDPSISGATPLDAPGGDLVLTIPTPISYPSAPHSCGAVR